MNRFWTCALASILAISGCSTVFAMYPDKFAQSEFYNRAQQIKRVEADLNALSKKKGKKSGYAARREKKNKDALTRKKNELIAQQEKAFADAGKKLKDENVKFRQQLKQNPQNRIAIERWIKNNEEDLARLQAFRTGKDYDPNAKAAPASGKK